MTIQKLIVDPNIAPYFEIDVISAGVQTIFHVPGPSKMPATEFLEHNSPLLRPVPFMPWTDLAIRLYKHTNTPTVPFRATVIAIPRAMSKKTKPRVLSGASPEYGRVGFSGVLDDASSNIRSQLGLPRARILSGSSPRFGSCC